ncbi:DUF4157 domain-containing protein [Streptomyces sp. NBC_00083]|uniref:eCIS core domain-containing protein n=1 Tax=Streptomyces sp. NBC_00083 TaxID=2975647 RepID=UPI00225A9274|nr:DUF4157 domain-containing protein [Streptomyces sp. NBC_00083]MCX5382397.1 DUF4157 domain-containing protein [Streptomyces sp. NBC_00083]
MRAPARQSAESERQGPSAGLLGMQATAGNAAVVQMLRQTGHAFVQEKHQHGAGCGHQQAEQPQVQRSAVHDVLRTPGRPLDDATRTDMESRLGADFSDVRIHNDGAAKASAAEVGAHAYTSGNHVVVGESGGDKHTLAHELTHVIQQRQGPVAGTDNGSGLKVSDPSDRFEREAEANATRVMRSAVRTTAGADSAHGQDSARTTAGESAPMVQRYAEEKVGSVTWRISQTGKYALRGAKGSDQYELYVRSDVPAPRYCEEATGRRKATIGDAQYVPYAPLKSFLEDCSHSAEEVMHAQALEMGQDASAFKGGGMFGESDKKNIDRAREYAKNRAGGDHDEAPEAGEAYSIIETQWSGKTPSNTSRWPYHVAGVVAQDGSDRITVEQTAGSTDADPTVGVAGIFDIYQNASDIGKELPESFHGRHGKSFSKGAITVTLVPINVGGLNADMDRTSGNDARANR